MNFPMHCTSYWLVWYNMIFKWHTIMYIVEFVKIWFFTIKWTIDILNWNGKHANPIDYNKSIIYHLYKTKDV